MKQNPKVTVLMPAYNAEKYIGTAIESILNQTYKDFEFIIVNDCSTDNTLRIINDYAKKDKRIRVISNKENQKIAKTLNIGLKEAKGEYIARMDADDWSYPDRLEKQVTFMEKNPNIVLSSGNMEICDSKLVYKNKSNLLLTNDVIRKNLLRFNPIVHPAMIYRKNEILQINGYDVDAGAEDYMLVIDMSSLGDLANLPDTLIKYRVLDNSITGSKMANLHIATLMCAFKAHLKYGYKIDFKTKVFHVGRLLTAYFFPSRIWRLISTRIKR